MTDTRGAQPVSTTSDMHSQGGQRHEPFPPGHFTGCTPCLGASRLKPNMCNLCRGAAGWSSGRFKGLKCQKEVRRKEGQGGKVLSNWNHERHFKISLACCFHRDSSSRVLVLCCDQRTLTHGYCPSFMTVDLKRVQQASGRPDPRLRGSQPRTNCRTGHKSQDPWPRGQLLPTSPSRVVPKQPGKVAREDRSCPLSKLRPRLLTSLPPPRAAG